MIIVKVIDKFGWTWMPDFAIKYTKEEDEFITKLWHRQGCEYIVDPLGCDQCLVAQYYELNCIHKLMFMARYGIVRKMKITRKEYEDGIWKD